MTDRRLFYICKYTPVEMLKACGADMAVLDHTPADHSCAECHAHTNICGFGKAIIDAVYEKGISRLVLVNCCDTIRSVYEVLDHAGIMDFLYLMDLPHKTGGGAVSMMRSELEKLKDAWLGFSGGSFDTRLPVPGEPSRMPSSAYIALAGSRVSSGLEEYIRRILKRDVRNMTCTNYRILKSFTVENGDLTGYAAALLTQLPCMRMDDISARQNLLNDTLIDGIIYSTVKFCDFYNFEYSKLRDNCKLPLLKIESDHTTSAEGQLLTRIEAFAEQLRSSAGSVSGKDKDMKDMQPDGYYAGIDVGSTSVDVIILDSKKNIAGKAICPTGAGATSGITKAFDEALENAGIDRSSVVSVVTTGYGRKAVSDSDRDVTEISCHARGARFLCPDAEAVLDIGGQDSKAIILDKDGNVLRFAMNDKCAAGTGRFLEIMAHTLGISLDEMSKAGADSTEELIISNTCTVFAESEVVSLISQGRSVADIVNGLNMSVAKKTASLMGRTGSEAAVLMTGGVAANSGVVDAVRKVIGKDVRTHELSQYCGAIGAALFATEGSDDRTDP